MPSQSYTSAHPEARSDLSRRDTRNITYEGEKVENLFAGLVSYRRLCTRGTALLGFASVDSPAKELRGNFEGRLSGKQFPPFKGFSCQGRALVIATRKARGERLDRGGNQDVIISPSPISLSTVRCDGCRKDMNENDYLYGARSGSY